MNKELRKLMEKIDKLKEMIVVLDTQLKGANIELLQHKHLILNFVAPHLDGLVGYLEDREASESGRDRRNRTSEVRESIRDSEKKAVSKQLDARLFGVKPKPADTDEWWEHSGLGLVDEDFGQGVVDWGAYYSRIQRDWFIMEERR